MPARQRCWGLGQSQRDHPDGERKPAPRATWQPGLAVSLLTCVAAFLLASGRRTGSYFQTLYGGSLAWSVEHMTTASRGATAACPSAVGDAASAHQVGRWAEVSAHTWPRCRHYAFSSVTQTQTWRMLSSGLRRCPRSARLVRASDQPAFGFCSTSLMTRLAKATARLNMASVA